MKLRLSSLGLTVMAAVVATAACQTYDFEPVEPLAVAQVTERRSIVSQAQKANIMLVVDKSGSMREPLDRNHTSCPNNCWNLGPNFCPQDCPTRISALKTSMGGFFSQFGTTARFGLAVYPPSEVGEASTTAQQCLGGQIWLDVSQSNDVDSEMQAHSKQIDDVIQAIKPNGGTPIAETLQLLANHPALNQNDARDDFVLLLTDGLPNCNGDLDGSSCTCLASACTPPPQNLNCMDDARVVQSIEALRANKIRTIVVAFGADVGNVLALGPLNAMAEAGGFARSCATADDCGSGQTCDGATTDAKGVCSVKFYKAADAAELANALNQIRLDIGDANPCEFKLDANPQDQRYVIVYVDGQKYNASADTWNFKYENNESIVTLTGSLCTKVLTGTPANPVDVEVRILEGL